MLEEVIKYVNQEKVSNNPNVVLGQSMGGLAARYALKDMENNNENHDTWLYVSHDAPHQGANVPLGFQYLDRHVFNQFVQSPLLEDLVVGIADGAAILYDVQTMFDAPSARQMLKYHVKGNYTIDNSMNIAWQNELENMGYPQQTRNIAISNGNHCAVTQSFNPGDELFRVKGNIRSGWLSDLLLTTFPLANNFLWTGVATITYEPSFLIGILPGNNKIKADFWAKALPQNGSKPIYRGFMSYTKKLMWLIPITIHITNENFDSPANVLPYDYYPGGEYKTPVDIESQEYQNSLMQYNVDGAMQEAFCFVPTPSALDLGSNLTDNHYLHAYSINNIPAPSSGLYIPFENFTTSYNTFSNNEVHISFNTRNGNWLADELLLNPGNFDCSYTCREEISIAGESVICNVGDYTITNAASGIISNWYIAQGNDIATLTTSGSITTLTALPNSSGYVTLAVNIRGSYCDSIITKTKKVWVGKPNINYQVDYISPDHVTWFDLVIDLEDIVQQQISDAEWIVDSGNGSLTPHGGNNFRVTVTGPNTGWYIQGRILITNDCGITEKPFTVGGGDGFEFDDNYALHMVAPDVYKIYNKNLGNYQVNQIEQIKVYNIYGQPVKETAQNNIDISTQNKGVYIIQVKIENQLINLKVGKQSR